MPRSLKYLQGTTLSRKASPHSESQARVILRSVAVWVAWGLTRPWHWSLLWPIRTLVWDWSANERREWGLTRGGMWGRGQGQATSQEFPQVILTHDNTTIQMSSWVLFWIWNVINTIPVWLMSSGMWLNSYASPQHLNLWFSSPVTPKIRDKCYSYGWLWCEVSHL